jgi:aminoglycoside phosphotransferase (APT) family kinase protein
MGSGLHDNEIPIDVGLVRNLVDYEFPQYAALRLSRLDASGSTNVLFRLGDNLLVRLPRQPGGSSAIDKERHWMPEVGRHLPVAVPEIIAVGEPAYGYGERWSIVRWLDGELPIVCAPGDPPTAQRSMLAMDLANAILALRAVDVSEAAATDPSLRWYRGRTLTEFDEQTHRNIWLCRSIKGLDLDLDAATGVWETALNLPGAVEAATDRWYHSDLVAENLLMTNDRLTGVLDFGGLAVGDPTIDLHGAWELFDSPARTVFRTQLGVGEDEWLRGRAWALAIALGCFTYYWEKMPGRRRDRLAMVQSVLAD